MTAQQFELKTKTEDMVAEKSEMFNKLSELKAQGARLITITALDHDKEIEYVYNFARDLNVVNLRVKTSRREPMPSISSLYPSAFLFENELQDLFKIQVSGISVDFGGKLLTIEGADDTTLVKPAVGPVPFIKRFYGRCHEQCPGLVNAPKYIRQIAEGNPQLGYSTVCERAPLPAILGRVCFAPCQEGCRQEKNEEPIQIRLLKRFAADSMTSLRRKVNRAEPTGKKIAVVGGGPAGVSCAYFLGMLGYEVTVYEKTDRCGGAMLWGIPKYRLPKELLAEEIQARFEEAGVTLKVKNEVKSLQALKKNHDAIFVAIGALDSYKLGVEGEQNEGIMDFRELLSLVNIHDKSPTVGDRVAIIGGGNSSIDAARVAKRLGAGKVVMYYRRTEKEMPASPLEIQGALQEGVSFEYLTAPVKITPGKPLKLTLQQMELGAPDDSGRRRPVPIKGSEYVIDVDTIIKAIGQAVVVPADFGVEVNRQGRIVINEETMQASLLSVYAGGDGVYGPSSVIEALRDGRKAAHSIDMSLGGKGLPEPDLETDEFVGRPINIDEIRFQERVICRELNPEERVKGFDEVELGFDEDEALREAKRCWKCDWNE
ncbi:MAG: FAD-dependent oxidoreductase [Candidatus Bathyarchaeota archaeon]|nr:FAD-dependent oxidoreductase [Candidatus Bathyarchaeota archaeon]